MTENLLEYPKRDKEDLEPYYRLQLARFRATQDPRKIEAMLYEMAYMDKKISTLTDELVRRVKE